MSARRHSDANPDSKPIHGRRTVRRNFSRTSTECRRADIDSTPGPGSARMSARRHLRGAALSARRQCRTTSVFPLRCRRADIIEPTDERMNRFPMTTGSARSPPRPRMNPRSTSCHPLRGLRSRLQPVEARSLGIHAQAESDSAWLLLASETADTASDARSDCRHADNAGRNLVLPLRMSARRHHRADRRANESLPNDNRFAWPYERMNSLATAVLSLAGLPGIRNPNGVQ